MTQKYLRISVVGVEGLQDEDFPELLIYNSSNQNEFIYYTFDNDPTNTKHTPPLVFRFHEKPVMFAFDRGGGIDLQERLKQWLLPKADIILVSLGTSISSQKYLWEEMEGRVSYLRWILEQIRQVSNKPTLYALNGFLDKAQLTTLHKEVNIPDDAPIVMYNRDDPASLEQLLKKLFAMSPK